MPDPDAANDPIATQDALELLEDFVSMHPPEDLEEEIADHLNADGQIGAGPKLWGMIGRKPAKLGLIASGPGKGHVRPAILNRSLHRTSTCEVSLDGSGANAHDAIGS